MAWFFRKLFERKSSSDRLNVELAKAYDPRNDHDRVGLALLVNLQKQLDLLGFEMGQVPAFDYFTTEKCRGYLYGLSLGILSAEDVELSPQNVIDTAHAAFGLVYGNDVGRDLSRQTAQDILASKTDVVWASDWAIADVKGVYESGGVTSIAGFYLAASQMI